jgi:hypothetical protein
MQKNNNILNSIIAANVALNASVQITDPTAANYIAAGEIVAARPDGTVINTTALANASSEYIIVQGQGTTLPLIKSPVIKKTNVSKAASKAYTAPTEQISYFGYNGTAGNIEAINSNEYTLRVTFQEDTKTFGDKMNTIIANYISDSSTSVTEVAFKLAISLNRSASIYADVPLKAEVITNGTIATVGAGVSAAVVNNSKTVTYSGGTLNAAIQTDSFVTLAGATYQVASRVGLVVTLTMPYEGASATIAAGTTYADAGYLTSTPTLAGIKITGLVRRFRAGVWVYYKVRFVVTANKAGTTNITNAQVAYKGIGSGKEIQEIEWETVGNEGAFLRTPAPGSPVPYLRLNSSENSVYSVINLQFFDQNGTGVVAAPVPSYKQLIIAVNKDGGSVGTSISDGTNGFLASLNSLLGLSGGSLLTL